MKKRKLFHIQIQNQIYQMKKNFTTFIEREKEEKSSSSSSSNNSNENMNKSDFESQVEKEIIEIKIKEKEIPTSKNKDKKFLKDKKENEDNQITENLIKEISENLKSSKGLLE